MPETTPAPVMDATDGRLLLHVPPVVVFVSVVLPPIQTTEDPVIAAGEAITVATVVT